MRRARRSLHRKTRLDCVVRRRRSPPAAAPGSPRLSERGAGLGKRSPIDRRCAAWARPGRTITMSTPYEVTDAECEEQVLQADRPVLVDFWAPWCGPGLRVAPVIDELAEEMGDRIRVMKLNTDENPESPGKYGVMSIPTLILFKDGQETIRLVGAGTSKAELKGRIEEAL